MPAFDGSPVPAGTADPAAVTTHRGVEEPVEVAGERSVARGTGTGGNEERRSAVPDSDHDPSLEGLGSRLRSGAKFASVALVVTQLISLGQTIVLARILSPLEIGTFALGTLFASFLTTMSDGGMRAALIHRGREVEDAANTVFWVSLVTGTLMSLTALAVAPLLTLYFDDRLV